METISINTTQNISLEYDIASVGDRILATLIDYAIFGAWLILCFLVLSIRDEVLAVVVGVLPLFVYHLAMESLFNGQSLGKMAMKIKVMKLDGSEPTLGAYLLRWLFRIIDLNLFSGTVALITIVINGKGQRLGDITAGTTVISLRKRVDLKEAAFKTSDPNYVVTFAEAANLKDADVIKIKKVFNEAMKKQQYEIIDELAAKVKLLLGIETTLPSEEFLRTLVRDYNHLMSEL